MANLTLASLVLLLLWSQASSLPRRLYENSDAIVQEETSLERPTVSDSESLNRVKRQESSQGDGSGDGASGDNFALYSYEMSGDYEEGDYITGSSGSGDLAAGWVEGSGWLEEGSAGERVSEESSEEPPQEVQEVGGEEDQGQEPVANGEETLVPENDTLPPEGSTGENETGEAVATEVEGASDKTVPVSEVDQTVSAVSTEEQANADQEEDGIAENSQESEEADPKSATIEGDTIEDAIIETLVEIEKETVLDETSERETEAAVTKAQPDGVATESVASEPEITETQIDNQDEAFFVMNQDNTNEDAAAGEGPESERPDEKVVEVMEEQLEEQAREMEDEVLEATGEQLEEEGEEKEEEVLEATGEQLEEEGEEVLEATGEQLEEEGEEVLEATGEQLEEEGEEVLEATGEQLEEEGEEKEDEVLEKMEEQLEEEDEATEGEVMEAVVEHLEEQAGETAEEVKEDIGEQLEEEAEEKEEEVLEAIGEHLEEAAEETEEAVMEMVEEQLEEEEEATEGEVMEAVGEHLEEQAGAVIDDIGEQLEEEAGKTEEEVIQEIEEQLEEQLEEEETKTEDDIEVPIEEPPEVEGLADGDELVEDTVPSSPGNGDDDDTTDLVVQDETVEEQQEGISENEEQRSPVAEEEIVAEVVYEVGSEKENSSAEAEINEEKNLTASDLDGLAEEDIFEEEIAAEVADEIDYEPLNSTSGEIFEEENISPSDLADTIESKLHEVILDERPCSNSTFGCCEASDTPAHGLNMEGCCLESEFGCCPDNLRVAQGPNEEGCGCLDSKYGCCPDGMITARGENSEGCGCQHSSHGCCPDQYTNSPGPDQVGCPCSTYEYGCCPDGETVASGPNLEGCEGCEASEHGCCPDNFTPAEGPYSLGCECAGSKFGCCPDGVSEAPDPSSDDISEAERGKVFAGCGEVPGEPCHLDKDQGSCKENFTVKWFFDRVYGGCSRFWWSDCGGNENRFDDATECQELCVSPAGSGRCYLPKVSGPCKGAVAMWYFDSQWQKCMSFKYGGCLGNDNRFDTESKCQESCLTEESQGLDVCLQPLEPGPCRGSYLRFYYDQDDGECKPFNYTGCKGNRNRFVDQASCENACRHKARLAKAKVVCVMPKVEGTCESKVSQWHFDTLEKRCLPFYYSGCGGNDNRFDTLEDCETNCPNAFPPEIDMDTQLVVAEEEQSALLSVSVEANPPPTIKWRMNGAELDAPLVVSEKAASAAGLRVARLPGGSLMISPASLDDSGVYTVLADNGLGQVARRQVTLKVYPSRMPIEVIMGKDVTEFEFGHEMALPCSVRGYPIPVVRWYKNNTPLPKTDRIHVRDDHTMVVAKATPIDGGVYSCRATNEHESVSDSLEVRVKQGELKKECVDKPHLANCALIVRANYCDKNAYYRDFCCKSCNIARQIVPEE